MADALEARGLGVRLGHRPVLTDVHLRVKPGTVFGVLGPNGAGKSTLLKVIAGLLPHDGALLIDGRADDRLDRRARARRIAYVPQHSALEASLPVREVVAQGRFAHTGAWGAPSPADQQAIEKALDRLQISHLVGRVFNRLSYGERRLVLLARALATGAPILLLDEPTAALDVRHALELLGLVRGLAATGHTVLMVLHQLQEAADVCDEALLLSGGRVVEQGPLPAVLSADPVRQVWGVELVPGGHFGFRLPQRDP